MHLPILFIVYFVFLMKYHPTRADKPYEVEIRSFQPMLFGKGVFDPKTLRVSRKGRNIFVLSGDFSLFDNLGEDSMMVYEIFKKSDLSNTYASVMKGGANICKFCSTNTNFYPRFLTFTNFPDAKTCPFPKGNYTIKDYTIDDKVLPAAVPAGTYALRTMFSKDNQNMFGYTVEFYVNPK